jgi:8-oxo-dGTP pyrophosphatase MutT (NUDIX family)
MVDRGIRRAATLLLVREAAGRSALNVFMVERPGGATAFGGLHVFPGGKVDPDDAVDAAHCVGLTDRRASEILGVERGGLAYWVAAIRESFEEAGVLLGRVGGDFVDFADPSTEMRFLAHRNALIGGAMRMTDVCARERMVLATDHVHYFSHWITPEGAPARFDTRFFLATMPERQSASLHADELADGVWISPAEALDRHRSGRWRMIHPTLISLETLAAYQSIEPLVSDVGAWSHLPAVTPELNRQGMQPHWR